MQPCVEDDAFHVMIGSMSEAVALVSTDSGGFPLLYANEGFARLIGVSRESLPGSPLLDLLANNGASDPGLEFRQGLHRAIPFRFECSCAAPFRAAFWGEFSVSPIVDSEGRCGRYVVVLSDLSERRQAMAALQSQRERLLQFIESVPLGVLALDSVNSGIIIADVRKADRPLIYVNAAFERLSGYRAEEVLGRSWGSGLFRDAPDGSGDPLDSAVDSHREFRTEIVGARRDGTCYWAEIYLSPVIDEQCEPSHYLGIVTDISERKETLRQLEELNEAIRRNRDDLIAILNQFPSGVMLLEDDGVLAFASDTCGAAIGIDPDQAVGRDWRSVLPFDATAVGALQHLIDSDGSVRTPLVVEWRDSRRVRRWVECAIKDDPRGSGRRLIFLDDVTELHSLRDRVDAQRFAGLIGGSERMRELYRIIEDVARGDWTALIEGETGTGKELVARAIHDSSPRKNGPFIPVNSAGLSESLLASQLFGHRKGAFTGATADQEGFFEAASGGTIFLDEIGDLPLFMQASLLRVLQEHEVTRVGETRARSVDVRVIAATHKDLATEVREGRFREDLLFRLRVARILIPPLRERRTDVPLLVEHFLQMACRQARKDVLLLQQDALQCLLQYRWPGNVRELRACIDYAVIHCRGSHVQAGDLPPELSGDPLQETTVCESPEDRQLDDRTRILRALERTSGNRSRAAKMLQMSRATFYRRLQELGMRLEG